MSWASKTYQSLRYTGEIKKRLQNKLHEIPDVLYHVPIFGIVQRPHGLGNLELRRLLYYIETEGYGVNNSPPPSIITIQDWINQ